MSAPSRGTGASRARSTTPPTSRVRDARGAASRPFQPRGRGRVAAANPRAEGLLQGLQAGTTARRSSENGATRGARGIKPAVEELELQLTKLGRGTSVRGTSTPLRGQFTKNSKTFSAPKQNLVTPRLPAASASNVDFMAQATTRFETLKRNREAERAKAIKDGFLADPDKKTTLDNAITPVGTCTEMCPAFERVERIVQRMVDKSEKVRDDSTRPDEERMVKRFRRSAAGYDEQLPSDIRTPAALKMTLDYLLDDIVGGGERLASVHKFVWDRTRGIRNDFSIQQVTKKEDVSIAVECLEKIARFHILSLHQLSNPEHLLGEQFDAHQDREQLNNTLLSLIYFYDDNRHVLDFPNEAEFRAYCIIFELQSQHPDLEDRMQSWPNALLGDGRVKTAFKLYAAAGNNIFDQGPLRPMTSFSLAQGNTGSFWNILASKQVSYLMACVAEVYFGQVRYMALQALWTAATSAPIGTRSKNQDWTLEELANVLGFDAEEQAARFCEGLGLKISTKDDRVQYLDVSLNKTLDKSSIPTKQVFSYRIVEAKRFRRTLTAVINGKTVPQAVREGLVETDEYQREGTEEEEPADDGESLFLPEKKPVSTNPFAKPAEQASANPFAKPATPGFNPRAPAFAPSMFQQPVNKAGSSASPFTGFGPAKSFSNEATQALTTPFAKSASHFPATSKPKVDSPTTAAKTANLFSKGTGNDFSFTTQSTAEPPPFVFGGGGFAASTTAAFVNTGVPATTKPFSFTGFTSQPTSISTTPSQPPTFSWPKAQENTQSIGAPGTRAQFYAANINHSNGPSMPHTTVPAGIVSNQQQFQPREPGTRPPQSLKSNGQTLNSLQRAHPGSQLGFPVEANDPPTSSTTATTSFPRTFPQNPSPLVGRSPAEALAQHQNTVVFPSVEVGRAAGPSGATDATASQANKPIQIDENESSASAASTRSGYPWSNPTMPSFRNRTRQATQPPKPQKPPRSAADQQRIVDALAYVMMTQANGNLMDEYVRLVAPGLINEAIGEHLKEVDEQTFKIKNEEYLREKYGRLTVNGFRSREVMRKRRRRIAAFAKMEQEHEEKERRRRENDEIRAEAVRSREIAAQVELNLQKEAEEKAEQEQKRVAAKAAKASQVAGKKRKSDAAQEDSPENRLNPTARPYTPRHKRSKTETHVGTGQASDNAYVRHRGRYDRTPQSAGRSLFSRNMSAYNVRLASDPPLRQKLDNTYTDYFRLKARGIDPETPFFPRTAKQEKDRLQQLAEQEPHHHAKRPPWKGNSTLRNLTSRHSSNGVNPRPTPKFTDSEMPPPAKSTSKPAQGPEKRQTASNSVDDPTTAQPHNKPTYVESVKDLLDELKNSRQDTEDTTDWFKTVRQQLEKEVEQDEQNIRVHQTIKRRNSSQTSSSGLMRSEAGYEFVPIDPKPGHTLSRTELRIRRTGARGLATKPIGGTPGYVKPTVSYLERSLRASLNDTGNGEQDVADADANATGNGVEPSNSELQPDDSPYTNDKGKQEAVEDRSPNTNTDPTYSPPGMPTGHSFAFANRRDPDETEEMYPQRLAFEDPLLGDGQFAEDEYDADDFEEEEEFDEEDYDDEDQEEEPAGPSHRGQYLSASPEVGSHGASTGVHSRVGTSVADAIDLDSD